MLKECENYTRPLYSTSVLVFKVSSNLHEHFPDDDIIVILEHCAEHNSYSVFLSLDIPETRDERDDGLNVWRTLNYMQWVFV